MRRAIVCLLAAGCGRLGFGALDNAALDDADSDGPPRQLQITVVGRGAVVSGSQVCTTQCSFTVSDPVALSAYAAEAWELSSDSCVGTTCSVAANVDQITISFVSLPIVANIAFLTSTVVSTTSGIGALDTACSQRAAAAGLTGNFIAFASTTTQNARDRLTGSRGWVRPDGLPVLDQPTDVGSSLPRAILLEENGTIAPDGAGFALATGSKADGTLEPNNNCANWTTATAVQVAGTRVISGGRLMLGGTVTGCISPARVICMQTGRNVAVALAPPAFPVGRRLFVTNGMLSIGLGIAGGDQLCQSEAAAASLSGTYRALLATSTQSAADHVGSLAGPWRRTDGALVALGALDAKPFEVVITIDAAGASSPFGLIAVGATGLRALGQANLSCNDWMNPAGAMLASEPTFVEPFNPIYSATCAGNGYRILCAELP